MLCIKSKALGIYLILLHPKEHSFGRLFCLLLAEDLITPICCSSAVHKQFRLFATTGNPDTKTSKESGNGFQELLNFFLENQTLQMELSNGTPPVDKIDPSQIHCFHH